MNCIAAGRSQLGKDREPLLTELAADDQLHCSVCSSHKCRHTPLASCHACRPTGALLCLLSQSHKPCCLCWLQINYGRRTLERVYQLHSAAINCMLVSAGLCVTASDDKFLRVWPLDFSDYLLEVSLMVFRDQTLTIQESPCQ